MMVQNLLIMRLNLSHSIVICGNEVTTRQSVKLNFNLHTSTVCSFGFTPSFSSFFQLQKLYSLYKAVTFTSAAFFQNNNPKEHTVQQLTTDKLKYLFFLVFPEWPNYWMGRIWSTHAHLVTVLDGWKLLRQELAEELGIRPRPLLHDYCCSILTDIKWGP